LLRWREERVAWRAVAQIFRPLDAALELQLELVPSKNHNDLLLRCVQPMTATPVQPMTATPLLWGPSLWAGQHQEADVSPKSNLNDAEDVESIPDSAGGYADIALELATLRAENASLRDKNSLLQYQSENEVLQNSLFEAEYMVGLDDPSEPPLFEYRGNMVSPCSTAAPSDFGFYSGCATPFSVGSGSHSNSGAATPTAYPMTGQAGQAFAMVPMFFAMGDRFGIPSGMVEQARAIFECHKTLPSQLVHPAMSCPGEVRMC